MIKMKRTNAKPEQTSVLGRIVDLPEYDVLVDGEIVGQVVARLSRESRHYSSGSKRVWYAKVNGRTLGGALCHKNDARDRVVDERGN